MFWPPGMPQAYEQASEQDLAFHLGPEGVASEEAYGLYFVGLDEFEERRIASRFAWSQGRVTVRRIALRGVRRRRKKGMSPPLCRPANGGRK